MYRVLFCLVLPRGGEYWVVNNRFCKNFNNLILTVFLTAKASPLDLREGHSDNHLVLWDLWTWSVSKKLGEKCICWPPLTKMSFGFFFLIVCLILMGFINYQFCFIGLSSSTYPILFYWTFTALPWSLLD